MVLVPIVKFICRRLLEITVIMVILVLIPNLPPHANFSKSSTTVPKKPLTGTLSINSRLNDVELWHKGDFVGPEGLAELNGELYTSLYTGDIVKLTGEHITPIVKFGKPCKHSYEESTCGRPLGIEFNRNGYLFAADAYYGLFKVNVVTGKKEQLVSPDTVIEGRKPKLFNSLALASNGDIYWTDSSSDFTLEDGFYSLLADPSGRLIHYDSKTKTNKVLIDELHFANGVALSEDEEFVIVAETGASRIQRYYLKGPKKGQSDIFVDGLPGLPDNLRSDGKGGFIVPLVFSFDEDHPNLFQSMGSLPLLRKSLARFLGVIEYVFRKIDELYPNEVSLKVMHYIGHFTSTPKFVGARRTTILRVNKNGQITDSVHNDRVSSFCDVKIVGDIAYLGSPFNDYLGRIPLSKLGWEDLRQTERVKRAAPVETPKSTTPKPTTTTTTQRPTTTTTPKPTTTTQKPTTTTQRPTTTTTPKPTTTTQRPTTTTQKPTTTTQRPTTTTQKPTTTTQKPSTTTPRPTTTTPKPTTNTPTPASAKPAPPTPKQPSPTQQKVTPTPAKETQPPKQAASQQAQQQKQAPPVKQAPTPSKSNQK